MKSIYLSILIILCGSAWAEDSTTLRVISGDLSPEEIEWRLNEMRRGESAPRKMVFDIIKPNRKAKPKHPKQPFETGAEHIHHDHVKLDVSMLHEETPSRTPDQKPVQTWRPERPVQPPKLQVPVNEKEISASQGHKHQPGKPASSTLDASMTHQETPSRTPDQKHPTLKSRPVEVEVDSAIPNRGKGQSKGQFQPGRPHQQLPSLKQPAQHAQPVQPSKLNHPTQTLLQVPVNQKEVAAGHGHKRQPGKPESPKLVSSMPHQKTPSRTPHQKQQTLKPRPNEVEVDSAKPKRGKGHSEGPSQQGRPHQQPSRLKKPAQHAQPVQPPKLDHPIFQTLLQVPVSEEEFSAGHGHKHQPGKPALQKLHHHHHDHYHQETPSRTPDQSQIQLIQKSRPIEVDFGSAVLNREKILSEGFFHQGGHLQQLPDLNIAPQSWRPVRPNQPPKHHRTHLEQLWKDLVESKKHKPKHPGLKEVPANKKEFKKKDKPVHTIPVRPGSKHYGEEERYTYVTLELLDGMVISVHWEGSNVPRDLDRPRPDHGLPCDHHKEKGHHKHKNIGPAVSEEEAIAALVKKILNGKLQPDALRMIQDALGCVMLFEVPHHHPTKDEFYKAKAGLPHRFRE